jgi:hypothetical protein
VYDTPGRDGPDLTRCIRAMELFDEGHPSRMVAEMLTAEGFECKSQNTARAWAEKGREWWQDNFADSLNRDETRRRRSRQHQAIRSRTYRDLRTGALSWKDAAQILLGLDSAEARLTGSDEPTRTQAQVSTTVTSAGVAPQVAAMVNGTPPPEVPEREPW